MGRSTSWISPKIRQSMHETFISQTFQSVNSSPSSQSLPGWQETRINIVIHNKMFYILLTTFYVKHIYNDYLEANIWILLTILLNFIQFFPQNCIYKLSIKFFPIHLLLFLRCVKAVHAWSLCMYVSPHLVSLHLKSQNTEYYKKRINSKTFLYLVITL